MVHLKASDVWAAAIRAEAMWLIEAERHRRQMKTDSLRALRLAQEAKGACPEQLPKKKAKSRGPDLTRALKSGPA